MAKKINIISDTENHELWFEDNKGTKYDIPYYFLNRIDIDGLTLYKEGETDKFPTLSDLVENKVLRCVYGYKRVRRQYKVFDTNRISIDKLIAFFKGKGFNVTRKAIVHNINAYDVNMKSGYRDEKNGYHLFTPCGANPLSFTATSLNKNCDWQETYEY